MRVRKQRLSLWAGACIISAASFAHSAVIFTENFESPAGSGLPTGWTANTTPSDSVFRSAPPSAPPDAPSSTSSYVVTDGLISRIGKTFTTDANATSYRLTWDFYSTTGSTNLSQRYYGALTTGSVATPGVNTGQFTRIAANNAATYQVIASVPATNTLTNLTSMSAGWHTAVLTVTPGAVGVGSYSYSLDGSAPVTVLASGAALQLPDVVLLGQNVSNGTAGAPDSTAWFDSVKLEKLAPAAGVAGNNGPADGSTGVDVDQDLGWTAGINTTGYEVFMDTNPSPTTLLSTQTATTFDPGTLSASTTYYWRIDSKNVLGDYTTGNVFSFTTAPEPASLGLLMASGLFLRRRRRA